MFQICSTGHNAQEIVNKAMFKSTTRLSTSWMDVSISFVEKWNGSCYVSNNCKQKYLKIISTILIVWHKKNPHNSCENPMIKNRKNYKNTWIKVKKNNWFKLYIVKMLASTNVPVGWICYQMARYRYSNLNLKALNENSYC